jgi:hypothetical protein
VELGEQTEDLGLGGGVYASASAAASTRRRTSSEMGRLPDSAYDAVLRLTPASRATSPIVATLTS